jgi:hypothetical protein
MEHNIDVESIFSEHPLFADKPITKLTKEHRIAQLWAGYGEINSFSIQFGDGTTSSFVIKRVNPPHSDGDDDDEYASVSHLRKLKSYAIEAHFYEEIAPILSQLTNVTCTVPIPYSIITINSTTSTKRSFQFILSDLSTNYSTSYGSLTQMQTFHALSWLAKFHSTFYQHPIVTSCNNSNDANTTSETIWTNGGYWHLQTRLDELESIDSSRRNKFSCLHPDNSQLAFIIDDRMNESSNSSVTLVHGDYKSANILFPRSQSKNSNDNEQNDGCAVVDFQYCGAGYGMKDVVMLIVSSVSSSTLNKVGEEELLNFYYKEFQKYYQQTRDADSGTNSFTMEIMKKQFELCLLDYVRFMAGWGFWGSNVSYAEEKAWSILKELVSESKGIREVKNKDVHSMTSADWKNAVMQRYPLNEF